MTNIKSRADQFSLIIHGQQRRGGGGGGQRGILGKRGCRGMWDTPVCPRSYSRILAAAYGARICPLIRKKSYSRISMRHILWQHPGNLKFLPSDFCCHNCCHKGKESECGSNCGSKNPRIRLFQDAAASCATLKSESQTQNASVRLKKSLMAPPLSCTFYIRTPQ